MRGVNKVILIGRAGKSPEIRYMPSGAAVAKVSIATSEQWKDKNTGEKKDRTEWHNVVFFGKLAEIVGQYVHKGDPIYICGQLRTNKWQDKSGNDRYTTEIVANEIEFLGSKNQQQTQQQRPAQQKAPPPQQPEPVPDEGFDDDIPF